MRPRPGIPAWLLISAAETRQLRRSAFTVTMAAVVPTTIGLLIVWAEEDTGQAGWGAAAGLLLITLTTLTAYTAGTTTLAARRQQFVLKRLRLSGASDTAIIAGVLTPLALLTILQILLLLGVVAVADGVPAISPALLLIAVGTATTAACVLAIATAAFTSAPELAQLTTSPIALTFVGGGLWAIRTPPADVTWHMLALPGVSITQLTRAAWHEPGATRPADAVIALMILTAVVTPVAVRAFRWDPRQ